MEGEKTTKRQRATAGGDYPEGAMKICHAREDGGPACTADGQPGVYVKSVQLLANNCLLARPITVLLSSASQKERESLSIVEDSDLNETLSPPWCG